MNDQLLNSYYYTPHFSNYVVRGLSFCLLGGWGEDREKREEKGRNSISFPRTSFFIPFLFQARQWAASAGGQTPNPLWHLPMGKELDRMR